MNKFEGIVTGNLANTPLKANKLMSPTEVAAFNPAVTEEANKLEPGEAKPNLPTTDPWETIGEERWSDPRLGESIVNKFHRVTRRMWLAESGGYLYAVATYAMTYVRGVSDCSITESMQFVPGSNAGAAKSKK